MVLTFKIDKTMQAIASLLHFHNTQEMSYLRLLKLLYIADRESLKETGQPITGDQLVAMEHGPVLSSVYNLIKGEHSAWGHWSRFFQKSGCRLKLILDPGNGKLSKYEIAKLREITRTYDEMNEWEMVNIVHEFPEWKRNDPGKSAKPIPLEHLLEAIGRAGDLKAIVQDARDQNAFDQLFASVKGAEATVGASI